MRAKSSSRLFIAAASAVTLMPPLLNAAAAEGGSASACESIYLAAIKDAVGDDWIKFITEIAGMTNKPVDAINKVATAAVGEDALGKGAETASNVAGAVGVGSLVLDNVYASFLRAAVRVAFVTRDEQTAHYGPADGHPSGLGEPGQPIRFAINVSMTRALPEAAMKCAELAGYKIPKAGPLADVPVLWSSELGSEPLERHGTVTYEPANKKTDADGTSTAVFTPNSETDAWGISGLGKEILKSGTLVADPLVLTGVNDSSVFKLGNVSQLFWGITTSWNVAYHRPRGVKFPEVNFHERRPIDGFEADLWFSGGICGSPWMSDSATTFWKMVGRGQSSFKGWKSYVSTYPYEVPMFRGQNGGNWDFNGSKLVYLIQPRFPPKMVLELTPLPGFALATPSIVTVPIAEETACPEVD